ncbi:MAG: restriction endonuclease subunit S [Giesbergeria sp.]|nr:restriction endonuclease subunit S [Giesbergeria sp.]
MGVIPEDWDVASLSDLGSVVRGGSPRPAGDPRFFNGSFIPWLTVAALTNISENQMHVSETVGFLTEEGSKHSRTLEQGTLIIANSGATLGVVKILGVKCCANDGIAAIVNHRKGDKEFVCHYVNTLTKYLREVVATGNGQPNLNTKLIKHIAIPFPTAPEQRAIATALSDVDALLAKIDQLIAKKRDLKQAAMQQLLTGQTRLPGFSGEWEVKRLGDLFAFSGGHTASRDQLSNSGYCYLHYGDIHKSTKTYIDLEAEYLDIPKLTVRLSDVTTSAMLKDGDVVFVDASEDDDGTSRHVVVVNPLEKPFISGLHTIVAKAKGDLLDNGFKRFCFQTKSIKRQFQFFAVGTKVSGISKTSIAKIELKFPPTAEQTAIATVLSDMDAELAALEARRDKTRALKQGMMQALLTGRIRLAEGI